MMFLIIDRGKSFDNGLSSSLDVDAQYDAANDC